MTPCRDCNKTVEPFKAAHWTCECGASITKCFTCDYQAYAAVVWERRQE